jgi:type III pantothenate kinase
MVLAVDIGNTNIVIGCMENNQVKLSLRIATDRSATELEYALLIRKGLEQEGFDLKWVEGSILSSVVPTVTGILAQAVEILTGKLPLIVAPGLKTGLQIMVENPQQLGNDRVTDAVAAATLYPTPVIIVDMGTATTISVVDEKKRFLGGAIMPGVYTALNSLSGKAAQLPDISLDKPKHAIGRNTVDAMRSGILHGTAGSVDALIRRIREELGGKCSVVCTGGLSSVITPLCEEPVILDPDLLLKGLMILYQKNR